MKTVAIAQARMGSTRVPGKVMRELIDLPVFAWTVGALENATGIDQIVVATTDLPADDVIVDYCAEMEIECFRGSETDVLDRFYQCAQKYDADIILRLTCDCPLLDPAVVSEVIRLRQVTGADYASNVSPPTYPDGLDVEVFTFDALAAAHAEATRPSDRDTVTQYISRNRHRFKVVNAVCPIPGLAKERWVLDTEDDWKFMEALFERIAILGDGIAPSYLSVLQLLDEFPALRKINSSGVRNERFYAAMAEEPVDGRSYKASSRLLARTKAVIPFGAQTFSKSHLQFPEGSCPLYATHGDGSRIFDVDGNDYVDLVGAILPVVLGYRDPDVDEAVREQLNNGISFSLATELEAELAEKLCQIIPCAEMVKFGKSGTDVTTAAIRLARAYSGRNVVLMSGYHGWSDWSMGPTNRDLGIPKAIKALSARIPYGDFDGTTAVLNKYSGTVACVIVEPNDDKNYLTFLREECDRRDIVLIFDEIITGFRYALGGAQELLGVTPDLATFGKAMGNGMPISALVGNRDIMQMMQPPNNIFYSGTMFGETLSIAAALATIEKMEREPVIDHLWTMGLKMSAVAANRIREWGLTEHISIGGYAPRRTLTFSGTEHATADQVRTMFLSGMADSGVLIINSHNISYAHNGNDLAILRRAYDTTCGYIRCMIDNGGVDDIDNLVTAAPLRMTS